MKKIIAAAAGLMMVGVMASSASAVENKFGGYWRTRAYTQVDFDGTENGSFSRLDTRTRLYYTAIFNENFKFVNKFEFDATWGGAKEGYGDVGADGVKVEVKNSYADFKAGGGHYKVGVHGINVGRGFLVADDAAGITAKFKAGDAVTLPFVWMRVNEKEGGPTNDDRDHFIAMPVIGVGEGITVQPMFIYDNVEGEDWNNFYAGFNVDAKTDAFSIWGTGVYEFGEIEDSDVSAFLLAAGAKAGPVHGQVFYATGDDDATDGDTDNFVSPAGASYYWAEILGLGMFDNAGPLKGANDGLNGNGDKISNIWAANVGFTVKPMAKLTLGADLWYAALAEDNAAGESDVGFEIDAKATYAIMDNLKLDVIAAYLIAGDAVGDEDPYELGARLSLSF